MSQSPNTSPKTSQAFSTRVGLFYGALFLIYGIHLPYFPAWLESRGIALDHIAWIVAAPLFLRIALTPALSAIADRRQAHRKFIIALAAGTLAVGLALSAMSSFWLIAIAALVFSLAFTGIMPLTETIAMSGVRVSGLDYGRMRLWGSATFIAASFAGGALIDDYGARSSIWLLCAAAALVLAATSILPEPQNTPEPEHTSAQDAAPWPAPAPANLRADTLETATPLLRSPTFILFLTASGFAQASHATYYAFGTLQWLHQGISPLWIGTLWVIGVVAEIALFTWSRAVVAITGPVLLLILGALAGAIRWTIMAFNPPLALLIPLQLLHAFTYGATHLGAIHFIARAIPQERTATAQAFYGATGNGIAMGCATLVSGWLFVRAGAHAYVAMAAISAIALVAALVMSIIWNKGLLRQVRNT